MLEAFWKSIPSQMGIHFSSSWVLLMGMETTTAAAVVVRMAVMSAIAGIFVMFIVFPLLWRCAFILALVFWAVNFILWIDMSFDLSCVV